MRPLWFAAAILAGMLALLAWNTRCLEELTEPLVQQVCQATQAAEAGDWEGARRLSNRVMEAWRGETDRLRLVQDHQRISEIALLLEEALAYLDHGEAGEYAAANARAARAMEELVKMEHFSLGNLF